MDLINKPRWTWEDMCGPDGLHPWNNKTEDLGTCFQQLFLDIPLLCLIAIVSGYYIGYQARWVMRGKLQENVIQFRSFVVLALALLPILKMYIFIEDLSSVYTIDYFMSGTECLTWLLHFGYALALRNRLGMNPRGPIVIIFLWSIAAVFSVILLRSRVLAGHSYGFNVATLCLHVLYALSLIPSEGTSSRSTHYSPCLVGSQYSQLRDYLPLINQDEEDVLTTAMQGATWLSKLFFHWVDPLFTKGLEKKIKDSEDLFDLPTSYRCSYISEKIDKALIGNVDKAIQRESSPLLSRSQPDSGYGAVWTSPSTSRNLSKSKLLKSKRHTVSLFRALHKCFGLEFYAIGILKFSSDVAGFAGPMLLNKLVIFVEDKTINIEQGYLFAAGLLLTTVISAFCNAHFNMWMTFISLKLKAAIISTVLRKTLNVTHTELNKSFSVGEITNFMSTDTDRIVNSCPSFHALWSIPLQMTVTLFLLYQQVGISFLAGIIFSIILIPINKKIADKIGQLSTELMHHKDKRVSLMSEIIKGIRSIKLHVWEDHFISKVTDIRNSEVKYLKGRKYLDAICVVFWATTPVLVTTLTLSTYVLLGNKLDAATVFTSVALMNMLIAPLNAFPWVLNGITEAWVSVKRIQKLLELPDIDKDDYYTKPNELYDEDYIITLQNATFSWAKSKTDRPVLSKRKKNKGKSNKGQSSHVNVQRRDSSLENSSLESLPSREPFILDHINFSVKHGQLIGIVGKVGSGKSSLLNALVAEMLKQDGDIFIPENIDGFGYVSQRPWLQRGSIRDNILFGKAYEETKFWTVVDACGLTDDVQMLGSNAQVGEGGCTLSGGQRARVALARAVYQNKQVYLLDDILSAVDVKVANHIFRKCIMGILRHKTRILVTHSVQFLSNANEVILMENGKIVKQGLPDTILAEVEDYIHYEFEYSDEISNIDFNKSTNIYDEISLRDRERVNQSNNNPSDQETRFTGGLDLWVIAMYLRSVGYLLAISILLSLVVMQISQNFTFLWLSYWVTSENTINTTNITSSLSANDNLELHLLEATTLTHTNLDIATNVIKNFYNEIVNKTDNIYENLVPNRIPLSNYKNPLGNMRNINLNSTNLQGDLTDTPEILVDMNSSSPNFYLSIYAALAVLNCLFTLVRAFLFAYGGVKAATKIHKAILKTVMKTKCTFFDSTPAGRILNRFSSDTYTVDDSLPFILNILLAEVFGLIGSLVVTVYGLPWIMTVLVPLIPIYHWLQHRYRVTSRELKRLHSVTLSPIYSHFNDTLQGMVTIRAFGSTSRSLATAEDLVDASQRASLAGAAAAQWLALRLQLMGVAIIAGSAVVAVLQRHYSIADPGLVGLAIAYALSVTSLLSSVMNAFPETEREFVAVERIGEYVRQLDREGEGRERDTPIPPLYGWPSLGVVCFDNVIMKYRDHLSPALKGVSFECRPAEKIGVVGRTGAGKSSLFSALMRLREIDSGRITIDMVDIKYLCLSSLRSRIAIIPQEPFIFTGTIRENLDPLNQYTEQELLLAIEKCGAREIIAAKGGVDGEARDLSQGHMQLLCLARAILQSAKIICIDEATANVDPETDRLIQETLRSCFRSSTVITIAHRISTVLDAERVLLLGDGRVLEFDAPDVLLNDTDSYLYQLVNEDTAE